MRSPPENLKELVRLGETLMVAMSFSQLQREKVDGIVREILAEREYVICPEMADLLKDDTTVQGMRVLDPNRLYRIEASILEAEVYPEIVRRQQAIGLYPEKPGCCPALEAESLQREAEGAFLEAIGVQMGVGKDALKGAWGEHRDRLLDLGLKLVAPFVGDSKDVLARFDVHPPKVA